MNTSSIQFNLNSALYLKNPQTSELGMKIITHSIELMEEIGYEAFTFKKLAKHISSTEASIYRYFENKHKILLYLSAWYWNWMQYRLSLKLANIESSTRRLEIAVEALTESITEDGSFAQINEVKLNLIIIEEASKSYLTKDVDKENEHGVFLAYKRLVQSVCDIILSINPEYKYPHMLVSTIIEGAHLQRFFADHLPRLTDTIKGEDAVIMFYTNLVKSAISNND